MSSLQSRDAVCYQVSACVAHPFPFLVLLCFVEQMVLIPMVAPGTAEVSSLMPLLYHGNPCGIFGEENTQLIIIFCL